MDLHRLKDSIAEMHLKFTSAGAICYMLMLTPTANFAVDPDQTVPRRAVRFGSKVFATKTSYGQTNIVDLDQTALREQFNPDPHCLLQRLDWNNLAEYKWRFAGVLMICPPPPPPPPPPGSSHHEYAQLMLDSYHKFLSTTFRRAQ